MTEVCDAIRRHATICQKEPDNIGAVISAGEALVRAVLEYEAALDAATHWSTPIRHLGRLPLYGRRDRERDEEWAPQSFDERSDATRIDVAAHYRLRIIDDDALLAFTSGRFGEEVRDAREAIKALFEAESWDPERYPPGLLDVQEVEVEISGVWAE